MKTEVWNGHEIRFVEKDGEWWAVLKDVCSALTVQPRDVRRRLKNEVVSTHPLITAGGEQTVLIIDEFGIYDTVFQSRKPEAQEFRYWVYEMLKQLRQSTGLEGFQIFRMLDKEHQREMMCKLNQGLRNPARVDFIKANTIANKAVSTKHGYTKMVKKTDMDPAMLIDRQELLEDTVELMKIKDKFGMDISVSKEVYKLATNQQSNRSA